MTDERRKLANARKKALRKFWITGAHEDNVLLLLATKALEAYDNAFVADIMGFDGNAEHTEEVKE